METKKRTFKQFVVHHKKKIIRGAIIVGGILASITAVVLLGANSNKELPETINDSWADEVPVMDNIVDFDDAASL